MPGKLEWLKSFIERYWSKFRAHEEAVRRAMDECYGSAVDYQVIATILEGFITVKDKTDQINRYLDRRLKERAKIAPPFTKEDFATMESRKQDPKPPISDESVFNGAVIRAHKELAANSRLFAVIAEIVESDNSMLIRAKAINRFVDLVAPPTLEGSINRNRVYSKIMGRSAQFVANEMLVDVRPVEPRTPEPPSLQSLLERIQKLECRVDQLEK